MEVYKLRKPSDSELKTECLKFDFNDQPFDPYELAQNLVHTMYSHKGVGLSYNQCEIPGEPYSVFAMRGHPENLVCFNPRIIDVSDEQVELEEGCLTYPNLIFKIERPKHVKVRFQTPNGEHKTEKFTGITARIFQHEMTHLEGERFWKDKVSRFHFERGVKKSKLDVTFKG